MSKAGKMPVLTFCRLVWYGGYGEGAKELVCLGVSAQPLIGCRVWMKGGGALHCFPALQL